MTGTTEQAPPADITGSIAGTSASNGARGPRAGTGRTARSRTSRESRSTGCQRRDDGNGVMLPKPRLASSRCPCRSGGVTATPRRPIPSGPI